MPASTKESIKKYVPSGKRKTGTLKGKIEWEKVLTTVPLKCMCWNVRNLGTLNRPGATGRGVDLEKRLDQVAQTIYKLDVDLCIILETGNDAEDVCSYLNSSKFLWNKWQALCTDNTAGETYTLILKKAGNHNLASKYQISLVGETKVSNKNVRQATHLRLTGINGYHTINIVALHAPSPGNALKTRLTVIEEGVKAVRDRFPTEPVILCGDLNIKRKDFDDLNDAIGPDTDLEGKFIGPVQENGDQVATSLRRFTTIISTEGDTESETYDQVWYFPPVLPSSVNVAACCAYFPPVFSSKTDLMADWLAAAFDDYSYLMNRAKSSNARSAEPWQINKALALKNDYLTYRLLINERVELLTGRTVKNLSPSLQKLIKEYREVSDEVQAELVNILPNRNISIGDCKTAIYLLQGKAANLSSDSLALADFNKLLLLTLNYLKTVMESGSSGVQNILGPNIYELCISDHLPVFFLIDMKYKFNNN